MKRTWTTGLIFISFLAITTAHAKERVIEGSILEYSCGDNCYLIIINAHKKQQTGLCSAPLCQAWNEKTEMPLKFKGRKVRITVGKGFQYDIGGRVMGQMDAFKKIDFIK